MAAERIVSGDQSKNNRVSEQTGTGRPRSQYPKNEKCVITVTLFLLSISFAAAQGSKATGEFDPGISVTLEVNPKARIDLATGREKSEERATTKWKVSAGVSFRVRPLHKAFLDHYDADKNHVLVLASGYEHSHMAE